MKVCSKCKVPKDEGEFHKDRGKKDGLSSWCKLCVKENDSRWREQHREQNRATHQMWKNAHRDRVRASARRCLYGLSTEQHQQMYLNQNGRCAICGKAVGYERIHTDHDHVTGKVRGLLCNGCNIQIAIFDNYDLWDKALAYLERTR